MDESKQENGLHVGAGGPMVEEMGEQMSDERGDEPGAESPLPGLMARGYLGGLLMGVANIVPGISGGAMLLLVGMYTRFILAIADLVTFRWRLRTFATLGAIGAGAGTSILFLAGPVKYMVLHHRMETFAVFIGMRLGSLPVVWRMARPATPATYWGALLGLVVTGAMATFVYRPDIISNLGLGGPPMMFAAGLAGAAAGEAGAEG